MSILAATVRRILSQLRHDPRSIGMVVAIPIVLMTLLYFMFDGEQPLLSHLLVVMLGLFPCIIMFLITSVAMLRERTSGTLERLLTMPLHKTDLLFGYGVAFGLAAALQGALAAGIAYWLLGLTTQGAAGLVVLLAILGGLLGVGLGLLCSAFARTEFQAVQMFPIVIIPQSLLCGLFVARDAMADWLQVIADILPLTYLVEALQEVGAHAEPTGLMWRDAAVVVAWVLATLALAAATLRRRTE